MRYFLERLQNEEIDTAAMRIPISMDDVLDGLHKLFGV